MVKTCDLIKCKWRDKYFGLINYLQGTLPDHIVLFPLVHDFHVRCCSCRLTVTLRLSLVKQELPILPERPSSLPSLSEVHIAQIFSCLCNVFIRSLFVLFLLAIVLSVFLRFMASDYPFGNFWLPLWYLLITPLVSSDYPLVSSDYPFGIFKLFLSLLYVVLLG